ncbi:MAG: amidohydrolase family protein [Myxococcota bacterium]
MGSTDGRPLVLGPDRSGQTFLVVGEQVRRLEGEPPPAEADTLDCADATIESGRINAHTHIYSGLAPLGMPAPEPPPETFVQILERVWWRLDRALDAGSLRAAARLYVAESLLAGTTTLIDHHESPGFIEGSLDVLAEACDEFGIRALLCYGATDRNGGAAEGRRGLEECRRLARRSRSARIETAVALHAAFTVSDETLEHAARLCRELEAVMHVHVAEDAAHHADDVDAQRRGYGGPLERLFALGALPSGSIVAHGLDLSAEQVARAEDAGLWIVQNPRSNHGNRVGYPRALAQSRKVALGTDGYPAVMEDEAAALAEHARAHGDDADAVARRALAGHALAAERFGGRFALPTGTETVHADLRVVEARGQVRHVLVAGRVVVRDGALVGADMNGIRAAARAEADRLWIRMNAV